MGDIVNYDKDYFNLVDLVPDEVAPDFDCTLIVISLMLGVVLTVLKVSCEN